MKKVMQNNVAAMSVTLLTFGWLAVEYSRLELVQLVSHGHWALDSEGAKGLAFLCISFALVAKQYCHFLKVKQKSNRLQIFSEMAFQLRLDDMQFN
jgi:hypothetical protein